MTPCKPNTHFLRDIRNLGYKSFEFVYEDVLMLTFSETLMLTGQLNFLYLFQSCPKSLTLDTWKEWKNAKSVPIDDLWESQLLLWSLVPGLCYPFSIVAYHGLVEYRVCSSQPDPWSFLKRENSEFGPTEAKAGVKPQSLTSCSLQSTVLDFGSFISSPPCWSACHQWFELPSWSFSQRNLGGSASLPMKRFWSCMSILFLSQQTGDTKIQSGTSDF